MLEVVTVGRNVLASCDFPSRLLGQQTLKRLSYYPRIMEAVQRARERLPRATNLREVAALAGMTPTSFSRYYSGKIGTSFSATMKRLRIELAMTALECGDCSIEEIAFRSGYHSGCALARAFREVTGETPSDYRRRVLSS